MKWQSEDYRRCLEPVKKTRKMIDDGLQVKYRPKGK